MTKTFKEIKIQLSKSYRVGHLSNHVNNCKSGFAVKQVFSVKKIEMLTNRHKLNACVVNQKISLVQFRLSL